jgi:hypothetical protein
LYREGLLGGLDRHDATIRTVVADRMRARVAIGISRPTPTAADLEAWLASHRGLYESPRRYEYGIVTFPGGDPASRAAIERYEQAMNQGADARTLGRPIVGGDLTDEDLKARLGPALAARIESLPVGRWQRLESTDTLRLVRLDKISGGLPGAEALRSQMTADWTYAERQRLIGQAVDSIVDRYHFEVRP